MDKAAEAPEEVEGTRAEVAAPQAAVGAPQVAAEVEGILVEAVARQAAVAGITNPQNRGGSAFPKGVRRQKKGEACAEHREGPARGIGATALRVYSAAFPQDALKVKSSVFVSFGPMVTFCSCVPNVAVHASMV